MIANEARGRLTRVVGISTVLLASDTHERASQLTLSGFTCVCIAHILVIGGVELGRPRGKLHGIPSGYDNFAANAGTAWARAGADSLSHLENDSSIFLHQRD
jgi:hypothetical protein